MTRLTAPQPISLPEPSRWRRFWSHPWLIQYHRLFALVMVTNLLVLWHGIDSGWWRAPGLALQLIGAMVLGNFAVAVLIRQQYVVNALFWLATRAPTSWPLAIRWQLAKVFHFGGLHSGCASAGSVWFALLLGSQALALARGVPGVSVRTLALGIGIVLLLVAMLVTAFPPQRGRRHDRFEQVHRFGGWSVLLLFWAQTLSTIDDVRGALSFGEAVRTSTQPWVLALMTVSVILPWLRLKRVDVRMERPSNHAVIARFDYGDTPFPGSSNSLSRRPLLEWHAFANIPAPGERGYRLIISRAGDWTGGLIEQPPTRLWVKGITTAGVAHIEVLFKRVLYVATGSGIGPVLPHLLAKRLPIQLVWATRSPRATYGDALVDEILEASPDALIWDTTERGKPDMVALAWSAAVSFQAEAVICIANQRLTREVIQGIEARGIPCYGAIWDS